MYTKVLWSSNCVFHWKYFPKHSRRTIFLASTLWIHSCVSQRKTLQELGLHCQSTLVTDLLHKGCKADGTAHWYLQLSVVNVQHTALTGHSASFRMHIPHCLGHAVLPSSEQIPTLFSQKRWCDGTTLLERKVDGTKKSEYHFEPILEKNYLLAFAKMDSCSWA